MAKVIQPFEIKPKKVISRLSSLTKRQKIIFSVLALVVLALIAGGIYYFVQRSDSSTATGPTPTPTPIHQNSQAVGTRRYSQLTVLSVSGDEVTLRDANNQLIVCTVAASTEYSKLILVEGQISSQVVGQKSDLQKNVTVSTLRATDENEVIYVSYYANQ